MKYNIRIIDASEGMYLTQARETPIGERIICRKVVLGKNDSEENWIQIPEDLAMHYEAEQKAEIERIKALDENSL